MSDTEKIRRMKGGKQSVITRKRNQQEKEQVKNMTPEEYRAYRLSKGFWA